MAKTQKPEQAIFYQNFKGAIYGGTPERVKNLMTAFCQYAFDGIEQLSVAPDIAMRFQCAMDFLATISGVLHKKITMSKPFHDFLNIIRQILLEDVVGFNCIWLFASAPQMHHGLVFCNFRACMICVILHKITPHGFIAGIHVKRIHHPQILFLQAHQLHR